MATEQNVYLILTPAHARTLLDYLQTQARVAEGFKMMLGDEVPSSILGALDTVATPMIEIRDDLIAAMDRADVEVDDASG